MNLWHWHEEELDKGEGLGSYIKCKGAPKKTSGRSPSWSAPLRATSSISLKAPGVPFCNSNKIQEHSGDRTVGIALGRERFTSTSEGNRHKGQRVVENAKLAIFFWRFSILTLWSNVVL